MFKRNTTSESSPGTPDKQTTKQRSMSMRNLSMRKLSSVPAAETVERTPLPFFVRSSSSITSHGPVDVGLLRNIDNTRWTTKLDFIFIIVGFTLGTGNISNIPILVIQNGGGAFFIPYMLCICLLAYPMMTAEFTLGQFCSLSSSRAFRLCPVLMGQGWSMLLLMVLFNGTYSVKVCQYLIYLIYSFYIPPPWTECGGDFNDPNCVPLSEYLTNASSYSLTNMSVTQFWRRKVAGLEDKMGQPYEMSNGITRELPNLMEVVVLFVVAVIPTLVNVVGLKGSLRLLHITVLYPLMAFFQLLILSIVMPGAWNGMQYLIIPDLSVLGRIDVWVVSLNQAFFSMGLATGSLITLASLNKYNDSIRPFVVFFLTLDFCTDVAVACFTFCVVGHLSHLTGITMEDLYPAIQDSDFYYTILPTVLSSLEYANFWCVTANLLIFSISIDNVIIMFAIVTISVCDYWPRLYEPRRKTLLSVSLALVMFFVGIFYSFPGGTNYVHFINSVIIEINILLGALEMWTIVYIYQGSSLNRDYKLMVGSNMYVVEMVLLHFPAPLLTALLTWHGFLQDRDLMSNQTIYVMVGALIALAPLFSGGVYMTVRGHYSRTHAGSNNCTNIVKRLFQPPSSWGPLAKHHWLISSHYAKKMAKYKNDQDFLVDWEKQSKLRSTSRQPL